MALKDFFFGKPEKLQQISHFSPGQQQIFQQLLGQQAAGGLGSQPLFGAATNLLQQILSGQDEGAAALQAPAMRQFQEQIIPGIAERFSGLGAGAQSSSAFQQALGGAGAGLAENLAAMGAQRQLGALPQALSFSQAPFQQQMSLLGLSPFENILRPGTGGFLGGLTPGLGQGLGMGLGAGLGSLLLR